MADGGDLMDGDLEDGEISGSGSDTEMGTAAAQGRPQVVAFSRQSFQSRDAAQPPPAAYRTVESSDSDPESSDEEAAVWRRKRQKVSSAPQAPACTTRPGPTRLPVPSVLAGRKVNNIWGSVVQEQCQEAITAELGIFGMEGEVSMSSRNVETYNFVLARKIMEKEREVERQSKDEGEVSMLDSQLEDYMKGRGPEESAGYDAKRKRAAKDRLGPRAEMDIKGRYEITEDDPEDKVIDEIAHRLQEPKKELIERVVTVVGKKKAIELLGETATLEENGGVYTMDGSRRRTPGGVYLNLLKNTPSITKAQIRKIFFEEHQKEYKSKKAAQKRRRHMVAKKMKQAIGTLNLQEHDDVSRETFASDTNEALESLEEAAEEEEEGQEEAAVGTEETAVVYNSADLEVF
ncbi:phosphorylated adapter RNA export protein [Seriola lalandi dorsalis]|uniref:Phosphorylated adapter RNA export protein n=1 Tax=Seriola lalandi dorsalis TaxID=1841481 RepID=A0A3B4WZV0_SERLL|nr:phosphorylated adapter RNA export protein [Seriola lalandi dorsalis]XP_023276160.1 phosphorylated adapter RNA export protein [Seriola lalandi dorsalis]XP_056224100.1 phosphorylated adapter RNA export protein [Seriola aureovittata]XP_056224101.1 phosphorylated adapter RNA export protein [Seriola aureovittata]